MTASLKAPTSDTKPLPKRAFARRKRTNKVNAVVTDERRVRLLELITEYNSIRRAALRLGVNPNTAKSIYYKFCKTGTSKRLVRTRKLYTRNFGESDDYEPLPNEKLTEQRRPFSTQSVQEKF